MTDVPEYTPAQARAADLYDATRERRPRPKVSTYSGPLFDRPIAKTETKEKV